MSTQQHQSIANYIKSFDGVRGICCVSVLLVHFPFHSFNLPSSLVYIGLHTFFIMSAFLITKNLLRDKQRSNNFWHCFRIFYIKRTARIFPLYFFYLVLVMGIAFLLLLVLHQSFGILPEFKHYGWMLLSFTYNLKSTILLMQNYQGEVFTDLAFPHLWSLSLEEQFYIFIIFVAWFANKRILQILSILFIVLMPIIRIAGYAWMSSKSDNEWLKTLVLWHAPFFQFDAFFYGIALTVFDFKKSKIYLYLFALCFILIASFGIYNAILCAKEFQVTFFQALRQDKFFYNHGGIYFMDSLVNLFCVFWFLSVIYYPEKFKLLAKKLIVDAGEITYGLYIFQFLFLPIGIAVVAILAKIKIPILLADLIGATIYVTLNFLFSTYIYRKLELPVIKWKDKILLKVYAEKKKQE